MPETLRPTTIDDNSKKIFDLAKKHGSLNNIPEEELNIIGYIREETGRVVKKDLLTKETELKKIKKIENEKKEKERAEKLKEKEKLCPFGLIEVVVEQKGLQGKRIPLEVIEKLEVSLDDYRFQIDNCKHIELMIPQNNPFWLFKKLFEQYLEKEKFNTDEKRFLTDDLFRYSSMEIVQNHFNNFLENLPKDFSSYQEINDENDNGDYLSSDKSLTIWKEFERSLGTLTDTIVFKKEFQEHLKDKWKEEAEDWFDISQRTIDLCNENNAETLEDFITIFIKRFLINTWPNQIDKKIEACKNFDEIIEVLKNVQPEDFSYFSKLKEIEKKLSTASVDQKKQYSQIKKELVAEQKNQKQIINGVVEALSSYQFIEPFFKKIVKKLQDPLVFTEDGLKKVAMYLDGKPNADLDRNPGEVSGDCTEGLPLPFANPEVPVYNVKVFDKEKTHIGNVYLLITKTLDKKQKCWHLEAIQIPSTIDWETSLPTFINKIGEEAIKKDVDLITINENPYYISNYDYIQKSFLNYQKKLNFENTHIEVPVVENKDNYSSFQGNGDVLILWKNQNAQKE